MDKDKLVTEFYTLKDVYNKEWIDNDEHHQRKSQLVDLVTNTSYSEDPNGSASPSRNSTLVAGLHSAANKLNLSNKANGDKSFSDQSEYLLRDENSQSNGSHKVKLYSSNCKLASPDLNRKDPGLEPTSNGTNVSTTNGEIHGRDSNNFIEGIHDTSERRRQVSSIDLLINKNSPPSTSHPTISNPTVRNTHIRIFYKSSIAIGWFTRE